MTRPRAGIAGASLVLALALLVVMLLSAGPQFDLRGRCGVPPMVCSPASDAPRSS